jgi:hypothetical protein
MNAVPAEPVGLKHAKSVSERPTSILELAFASVNIVDDEPRPRVGAIEDVHRRVIHEHRRRAVIIDSVIVIEQSISYWILHVQFLHVLALLSES